MPDVSPAAAMPLLALLVIFLLLYLKNKQTYSAFVQALNSKDYALREYMVVGFALMDRSGYGYGKGIDRKLRRNLLELYEPEYVEFYLRVAWAGAVTYGFLGLLVGCLASLTTNDPKMVLLGAALAVVLAWASLNDTDKKVARRHLQVSMDLPDLTNQILILSGAGLTLRAALIKIANEMESDGPLYAALRRAVAKLENGATDEEALDVLTVSCNMPETRRLVSVLLQNMRRGGSDVTIALREIGRELWDNRKAAAKQIAEETTTKMLFPMMLMLVAVVLLMAAPAVMSMMNI